MSIVCSSVYSRWVFFSSILQDGSRLNNYSDTKIHHLLANFIDSVSRGYNTSCISKSSSSLYSSWWMYFSALFQWTQYWMYVMFIFFQDREKVIWNVRSIGIILTVMLLGNGNINIMNLKKTDYYICMNDIFEESGCVEWLVCLWHVLFRDVCSELIWLRNLLVWYMFIEANSCSVFRGELRAARHVWQVVWPMEILVSGYCDGHTCVSVDIVVLLWGGSLSLGG